MLFLGFLALNLFAQEPIEVRMGIREILGESQAVKARLGILEEAGASERLQSLLNIARFDLELIGLVEMESVQPAQAADYPHPLLTTHLQETEKGHLLHAKITAGASVIGSANIRGSSETVRWMGHRLAREILRTLTGEKGFFTSKIAFALKYQGRKEIWISDWDGKNAEPITAWRTISMLPAFSPDGSSLMFTSYKNGNPDLFRYHLREKSFEPVSEKQGLNSAVAYDPKGNSLVLTLSRGAEPNLFRISPSGQILQQMTRTSGVDTSPCFSPNGEELVFTSDRSGNPQIFVMRRDGTHIRRLTYGLFWADSASWSPDGSAIAFSAKYRRKDPFQIFLTDPLGLKMVMLTTEGGNEDPSFSPDGRFLAFTSNRNGKWEIFIQGINPVTPEFSVLSFKDADAVEPAWSPLLE